MDFSLRGTDTCKCCQELNSESPCQHQQLKSISSNTSQLEYAYYPQLSCDCYQKQDVCLVFVRGYTVRRHFLGKRRSLRQGHQGGQEKRKQVEELVEWQRGGNSRYYSPPSNSPKRQALSEPVKTKKEEGVVSIELWKRGK